MVVFPFGRNDNDADRLFSGSTAHARQPGHRSTHGQQRSFDAHPNGDAGSRTLVYTGS